MSTEDRKYALVAGKEKDPPESDPAWRRSMLLVVLKLNRIAKCGPEENK